MPVGEGQMETVAHDGSGDGGGGRRKEVLGWAGREGGGGLGRCHCSCSSCCFPPPTRPESACVCSSPVAAQRGMICRNNQREKRVLAAAVSGLRAVHRVKETPSPAL